ncbi:MAG: DUF6868 family protein [Luteolibacter sp.]
MNVESIREFLGWCTVINFGIMLVTTIMIIGCQGFVGKLHGKLFGIGEADLRTAYFQYLANYKIAIIVFNMVPYLALCIME